MAIIKFANYQIYKETLDRKMSETAGNFVTIGYLLKLARDTDILAESGYFTIADFAKTEYGLDSTATSRFIAICERYGNGEDRLLPQYENYGYSKLSEMLTLPEAVADALPPEITREELREIKQEIREEEQVSDIEIAIEEAELPDTESDLLRFFRSYLKEFTEEFRSLWQIRRNEGDLQKEALDVLAPNGSNALLARADGIGRMMLRLETDKEPVLVNIRMNTSETIGWEMFKKELSRALGSVMHATAEDAYRGIYGEPIPEKAVPAPEKPTEQKPKKPKNVKIAPAQKKKEKKKDGNDTDGGIIAGNHREMGETEEKAQTVQEEDQADHTEEKDHAQAPEPEVLQGEQPAGDKDLEKAIRFTRVILEKLEENGRYVLTKAEFDVNVLRLILKKLEEYKADKKEKQDG